MPTYTRNITLCLLVEASLVLMSMTDEFMIE